MLACVSSSLCVILSQAIERKKEEQRNLLQEIQKINEENLLSKEQKRKKRD